MLKCFHGKIMTRPFALIPRYSNAVFAAPPVKRLRRHGIRGVMNKVNFTAPSSSLVQDVWFSAIRQGFESPWGYQYLFPAGGGSAFGGKSGWGYFEICDRICGTGSADARSCEVGIPTEPKGERRENPLGANEFSQSENS